MVETAMVLLAFFAFVFLLYDLSWVIFAKVTLQHAVREGVRYAVTSPTGANGQIAAIKQKVQDQSMGFLSNSDLTNYVSVDFYAVGSTPPTKVTGTGSNRAGNLVVVSVNGWQYIPIAPVLHSSAAVPITVSSGDLIESDGTGTAPPPL